MLSLPGSQDRLAGKPVGIAKFVEIGRSIRNWREGVLSHPANIELIDRVIARRKGS